MPPQCHGEIPVAFCGGVGKNSASFLHRIHGSCIGIKILKNHVLETPLRPLNLSPPSAACLIFPASPLYANPRRNCP